MKITYTNSVLDYYSGQTNCEAGIYVDDEIVGVVQYVLYDDELSISDIFIRPEFRRMGFGSRLMKFIKEQNPEYKYVPSMKTELGSKFKHKDVSLTEAKFVYEALNDILKPKSDEEIKTALKNLYRPKDLRMILDSSKNLKDFLNTFYLQKSLWDKDTKHPEYKKLEVITPGSKWQYPVFNVTEEAKKIILKCTDRLKFSPEKLKVIQTSAGLNSNPLINFMYKLNGMRNSVKHSNNDIIEYRYYGDDYAFFGNSNGWAIFIIPPNFINKIYGIRESVENILKPKSNEEIKNSLKNVINNLNTVNVSEFIDSLEKYISTNGLSAQEAKRNIKEILHVCKLMNSDTVDVEFINEEDPGYETVFNLFHTLNTKTIKNTVGNKSKFRIYKTHGMTYTVNIETKTVMGSNSDFNSSDTIFFDYPYLMSIIDKWENLQI